MSNLPQSHPAYYLLRLLNLIVMTFALLLIFEVITRYTGFLTVFNDGLVLLLELLGATLISTRAMRWANQWLAEHGQGHLSADILLTLCALPLLFAGAFGWTTLIPVARQANNAALLKQEQGDLTHAKSLYLYAARLQPNNAQIQYNLGTLYEDLADSEAAKAAYLKAIEGQLDSAYNNFGRILILEGNANEAIGILQHGLARAEARPVRYTLYKNLGWAQLEALLYEEAEQSLQSAIDLMPEAGAAHCLQGRLNQAQAQFEAEHTARRNCLQFADPTNPDEAGWIGEARRRLDDLAP